MNGIDHTSFPVQDFAKSKTFYQTVLAPLGLRVVVSSLDKPDATMDYICFGDVHPCFCINSGGALTSPIHLAFTAPHRAAVDAFYAIAIKAGAVDNGPPGLRTEYHPYYYAAFVRDPDGHNIEAVCHAAE